MRIRPLLQDDTDVPRSAAPPLPARYYESLAARVARLVRENDALRAELLAAVDALPPKSRRRYVLAREDRGGVTP
jgi:hypothetical protein